MASEIRFIKDDTGKIFEEVAGSPETITLKYHNHLISSFPMQSEGYANCNGIVLLGDGFAGLSHYALREYGQPTNADKLTEQFIESVLMMSNGENGLVAVLIGGDSNHFQRNMNSLRERSIPIVGEYLDGWQEDKHFLAPEEQLKWADKHLVVVPSTKEVIMYSKPAGYIRLS